MIWEIIDGGIAGVVALTLGVLHQVDAPRRRAFKEARRVLERRQEEWSCWDPGDAEEVERLLRRERLDALDKQLLALAEEERE